jgi:hypothetical protein
LPPAGRAPAVGSEQEVLAHVDFGENPSLLEHQDQAHLDDFVRRQTNKLDAIEHGARGRPLRNNATERLQARGCTGAVGAQLHDDFAAPTEKRAA